MKKTIVSMAAAAVLLAGAGHAAAQDRSSTRGLLLGAHLNGTAIQLDEDEGTDAENGIGGGLIVGFGFSEQFSVFLRGDGANISEDSDAGEDNTFTLVNLDLGGRYTFGSTAAALRPFAEAGFTATGLGFELTDGTQSADVVFSGGGLFLGGGLEYFFTPKAALNVGLAVGKGRFTAVSVDGGDAEDLDEDQDFTTSRLSIGVSFRP
jgi:hypothetical protein